MSSQAETSGSPRLKPERTKRECDFGATETRIQDVSQPETCDLNGMSIFGASTTVPRHREVQLTEVLFGVTSCAFQFLRRLQRDIPANPGLDT